MKNDFSDGFVKCGYATLHYCSYGSGTPIVMLHGNMQSSKIFKNQVDFFREKYRVITIDSRGHGKSNYGKKRLSIDIMAVDVIMILNNLNIEKAIFFGFSDGANITLKIANLAQKRLIGIILISPNTEPLGIKYFVRIPFELVYSVFYALRFIQFFDKLAQKISLVTNSPNISDKDLKKLKVSTLILAGQYDIIEEFHTENIAMQIPNAKLKIIKEAGHNILNYKADDLNKMLLSFINTLEF